MEYGEFHHKDGWFFSRLEDGSVQIRNAQTGHKHVIDAGSWASIVGFVGIGPDDGAKFADAARLHGVRLG